MSERVIMHECTKSFYGSATSGRDSARWIALLLGLSVCLLLSTCHSVRRQQTARSPGAKPVLSASPNPVPAGDLDQPLGSTQISWNTGNGSEGDVYVKVNRDPEVFLRRGPSGTLNVRWIQFDSTYEFRLYTRKRSRLLAKLDVTRDN
jgi:hypothetical protein